MVSITYFVDCCDAPKEQNYRSNICIQNVNNITPKFNEFKNLQYYFDSEGGI